MKTCKVCQDPKPLTEFYRQARTKDGLCGKCKTCHKAYTKIYLKENREAHCKTLLKYYYKNKGVRSEYRKTYYEKTKDKAADYQKEWRKNNPDKVKSYAKKHNKKQHETH
jgi:hypothetical protein